MKFKLEFDHYSAKEFKKLDKQSQKLIKDYLNNKVLKCSHPSELGKPLKYSYATLWRYRVGKYRVICSIEDNELIVLVLKIGKRDSIYKDKG